MMPFFLLLPTLVWSYTLNNNFGANFKQSSVKVFFASNTVCANAAIQASDFEPLIKEAIEQFWNTVPTSRLRLKYGGPVLVSGTINTGRLCAYTDGDCTGPVAPAVDDIVIACNNNTVDNFIDANILALTLPNTFKGRHIRGSVILINESSNAFANLNDSERVSVLAHEIGHAIGLGHSNDSAALMYYKTIGQRDYLGQDDIDGVTALYPTSIDGCGLIKSSVKNKKSDPPSTGGSSTFLTQMFLGFLGIILASKFYSKCKKLVPLREHSVS